MSSFDIAAVYWKSVFSRGLKAGKMRIIPHLSFSLCPGFPGPCFVEYLCLHSAYGVFFLNIWDILGWFLQNLLHHELLIHFHLVIAEVPAESLLSSSVWLRWVFLFCFLGFF